MLTLQELTEKLEHQDIVVMLRIIDDVREKLEYAHRASKPMLMVFTCNWMRQAFYKEEALSIISHATLTDIRELLVKPFLIHVCNTCKSSIADSWYRECKDLKDRLQPDDYNFICSFIVTYSHLIGRENALITHSLLSADHPYNEELYLLKLEWLNFLEDQFKSFIK